MSKRIFSQIDNYIINKEPEIEELNDFLEEIIVNDEISPTDKTILTRYSKVKNYLREKYGNELSEEEIRLVIERMSNCKVLFPADQAYVSWEVRQHFLVGIHLALVDAVLRLHLRVYAPHVRVVVLTSDVQGVEQFCRQLSGSTVHCTAFG